MLERLEEMVLLSTWIPEGPAPTNNGQSTVQGPLDSQNQPLDPVIGAVKAIVADPGNANIVYVGSVNGGVWKTTDATDPNPSWTPLTDNLPSLSIGAMSLDPTDPTHQTLAVGIGRFSSLGGLGGPLTGVLVTHDGGKTWSQFAVTGISGPTAALNISGVAIRGSTIVVSVNGGDSRSIDDRGIYRSTDGGKTFTNVSNAAGSGLPLGVASDLQGDPTDPNVLYTGISESNRFGGQNGIYRSADRGATWIKVSTAAMDALIHDATDVSPTDNIRFAVGNAGQVFVGIVNSGQLAGMFRSPDGMSAWQQLDTPTTNEQGHIIGLQPDAAGGPDGSDNPADAIVGPNETPGGQGAIHFSIAADPTNPQVVYVGGDRQPSGDGDTLPNPVFPNSIGANDYTGRLFRGDASQPSGSQWVNLTNNPVPSMPGGGTAHNSGPHADSRALIFDANGNLLEGDDGGIYRRTSPQSSAGDWFSVIGDLEIAEVHNIAYDDISNVILGGAQDTGTVLQGAPGSTVWNDILEGDGSVVAVDDTTMAGAGDSIRFGSAAGFAGFFRQVVDSQGNQVSLVFPNLTVNGGGAPPVGQFNTPIALDSADPSRLVIVADDSVYESSDQGDTLTDIGTAVPPNAAFLQDAVVYGGVRNGVLNPDLLYVGRNNGVYIRTTAGGTLAATPTAFPGTSDVTDIAVLPNDWSTSFVTDGNQVFEGTNSGASWTDITGNLPTVPGNAEIRTDVILPGASPLLLVGGAGGVFQMSLASPGVWTRYGTGLPDAVTSDLEYDAKADVLVAGTLGRGVWEVPNAVVHSNQPPTIDPISDLTLLENSPTQTVDLTGITDGAGDSGQSLTITATSNNHALIPNPIVTYASPASTGTLQFTPLADAFGTATITVTIRDNGGTANGGVDTTIETFDVAVTHVNQAPTIRRISDLTLFNSSAQTVNLSGIGVGPGDVGQTLTVTATSNNPGLIPNPKVTYTSPGSTGTLRFTPAPKTYGTATITVTVHDNGGTLNGGIDTTTETFNVNVDYVNQAPTINAISDVTVLENAAAKTINLGGIGDGPGDSGQVLTVTATSSNPGLIPDPTVTYTSPGSSGTLQFTPAADAFGTATITVTVQDDGGTAFGGHDTTTRTFKVTVTHVNQAPIIDAVSDVTVLENAGAQTVDLGGIGAGPGDAGQILSVTASSSNPGLIPNPTVTYSSPGSTGTLQFTPAANASGTATITVTVKDNGGTANGGVDTTTETFNVTVTHVNQAPTISTISDVTVLENAGAKTINLGGIGAGPGDTGQVITVTASSGNPGLIPDPMVTYTSPGSTGTLRFTPAANAFGSAVITVTLQDNGGTGNGGVDTTTETFNVIVTHVNQAPTVDPVSDVTVLENAGAQSVSLSGIGVGPGDAGQTLTVTASSSNPGLIPDPTINYASPNSTGTLRFTPAADAFGTATITLKVKDSGGTANGGVDTVTKSFVVTVTHVNQAPTINSTADLTVLENAGAQAVDLGGIGTGPGDAGQVLTIAATSNNPGLIPDPTINYTSPGSSGTLRFTPAADAFGTATITVTVQDDGGTANGGVDTVTRSFVVTVTHVNQAPTINSTADVTVLENAGAQTVGLGGIGDGPGDSGQVLTVTATSSNPGLIPDPTVTYSSPDTTGTLQFTPAPDAFGTATITVTIKDNGGTANTGVDTTTETFNVTVTHVNQAPTVGALSDVTVLENAAAKTVSLGGIGAGPGDAGQTLSVTATSSNPGLVPDPTVTYASPGGTGTLQFTPAPDASGTATITVTVKDNGGTANGGVDTTTETFNVTVTHVNQAPTIDAVSDVTVLENAGAQSVSLSGIGAGPGDAGQILSVIATSSNPGLVPDPTVTYANPGSTGTLQLTPAPDAFGTATITVTIRDDGGTANGGSDTTTETFNVTVLRVNQAPTISSTADITVLENAGAQTVSLGGIGTGAGDAGQTLTVTASSSDTGLIPDPTVTYASPAGAGTLQFTPAANASGTATITVKVHDSGGTADGGVDTTTETFHVTVLRVNQAPTINPVSDITVLDTSSQTVSLGGIGAGPGDTGQTVTLSARSNTPTLIPNPTVTFNAANGTGALQITPAAGKSGTAVIIVTAHDDGGTANGGLDTMIETFRVTVVHVNQAPTIGPISDVTVAANAPAQTVGLLGIGAGANDAGQSLTVAASSSNPAVVPDPTVTYTSPGDDGSLQFTPVPGSSGTAVITVTVKDDGGTADGGVDTTTTTFTVNVQPAPTPPPPASGGGTGPSNGTSPGTTTTVNQDTPSFSGSAAPGELVQLFAQGAGQSAPVQVGQTTAGADGSWAITSTALADGTYTFSVTVTPPGGAAGAPQSLGTEVIDSVGPTITGVQLVPNAGQVLVTVQDGGSGVDPATLLDPANYSLTRLNPAAPQVGPVTAVAPTSVSPASETVKVIVNGGRRLGAGRFILNVKSGGIKDHAGNPLDGEFTGRFPTGDGRPGGATTVRLDFNGRRVLPPRPVVTPTIRATSRVAVRAVHTLAVGASHPLGLTAARLRAGR